MNESVKTKERDLKAADLEKVKSEIGDAAAASADVQEDPEIAKQADQVVKTLLGSDLNDGRSRERSKAAVENLAMDVQKRAAHQSTKLKDPISKISGRAEDGGDVGTSLINLRVQVEALDPARFDFSDGWFSRTLGYIPGVGSPLKRYFSKYESAQTIINAIIQSLEIGRDQLKRDNITLTEDQRLMRDMTVKLLKSIELAKQIDRRLQEKLDSEIPSDDPRYAFIAEELLFPLRQRTMDLQQQLAVNQQAVLAMEIVIRNNRELIRGVNRALSVTVNALQVAVTVALALADQKIVLSKVQALTETTSTLIANTAARLKTQGAEIQKQASTTSLDMEALKSAFADINDALEDIAKFRQEALPQMAQNIIEMDSLTGQAEEAIQKKEKARTAEPIIPIEIE